MIYKKMNKMKNQKETMYNHWHRQVKSKGKQNRTSNKKIINQNLNKLTRTKRMNKNLKMMENFSKKKIQNRQKMKHNKMKNKWKMRSSLSNPRILLNPIQKMHMNNKIQNQRANSLISRHWGNYCMS